MDMGVHRPPTQLKRDVGLSQSKSQHPLRALQASPYAAQPAQALPEQARTLQIEPWWQRFLTREHELPRNNKIHRVLGPGSATTG